MPTNEEGSVKVRVNGETLQSPAVLRYAAHRRGDGVEQLPLYRYGLEFVDMPPQAIDASSRIIQRYAVAPGHTHFESNDVSRSPSRALVSRRTIDRSPFKVPVCLETPGTASLYACTRDISTEAMRCILAHPVADEFHGAKVFGPETENSLVTVRVVEGRDVTGPPHRVREYVMAFVAFEGQGRSLLQSLCELSGDSGARRDLTCELDERHRRALPPRRGGLADVDGAHAADGQRLPPLPRADLTLVDSNKSAVGRGVDGRLRPDPCRFADAASRAAAPSAALLDASGALRRAGATGAASATASPSWFAAVGAGMRLLHDADRAGGAGAEDGPAAAQGGRSRALGDTLAAAEAADPNGAAPRRARATASVPIRRAESLAPVARSRRATSPRWSRWTTWCVRIPTPDASESRALDRETADAPASASSALRATVPGDATPFGPAIGDEEAPRARP